LNDSVNTLTPQVDQLIQQHEEYLKRNQKLKEELKKEKKEKESLTRFLNSKNPEWLTWRTINDKLEKEKEKLKKLEDQNKELKKKIKI